MKWRSRFFGLKRRNRRFSRSDPRSESSTQKARSTLTSVAAKMKSAPFRALFTSKSDPKKENTMMINWTEVLMGFGSVTGFLLVAGYVFHRSTLRIQPMESVLLLAFGKCREVIESEGLHFRPILW